MQEPNVRPLYYHLILAVEDARQIGDLEDDIQKEEGVIHSENDMADGLP